MKANPKELGQSVPKLEWDDLEEDVVVLTISGFDQQVVDDDEKADGKRTDAWLFFKEAGDKRLFLNVTQMQRLVDEYGDETDDWYGKKCPVERVTKTFGKEKYKKVWVVVDEDEFHGYVKPARRKAAKKKKATRGRGK